MTEDYWVSFWKSRGLETVGQDPQTRICRTSNKQPISPERWETTLAAIHRIFPVNRDSDLLDLCAGNGLFSQAFAERGARVTAVDISADLLAELNALGKPGIVIRCEDMRKVSFPPGTFTHVFLYAGIQYISHAEAVRLLRSIHCWLEPGGIAFIGDIPDAALRWAFYNTAERRTFYFDNLSQGQDVIGTWFERDWIRFLAEDAGFKSAAVLEQDPSSLNAHFRFDAVLQR